MSGKYLFIGLLAHGWGDCIRTRQNMDAVGEICWNAVPTCAISAVNLCRVPFSRHFFIVFAAFSCSGSTCAAAGWKMS